MLVPLLDRAIEAGGDGPPVLLGPKGKPFMLMFPLEPPEFGGEARFPRGDGKGPSSTDWYLETDHSLPPKEIGDSGALRPALMLMMVKGSQKKKMSQAGRLEGDNQEPVAVSQNDATRDRSKCRCVVPGIDVQVPPHGWRSAIYLRLGGCWRQDFEEADVTGEESRTSCTHKSSSSSGFFDVTSRWNKLSRSRRILKGERRLGLRQMVQQRLRAHDAATRHETPNRKARIDWEGDWETTGR